MVQWGLCLDKWPVWASANANKCVSLFFHQSPVVLFVIQSSYMFIIFPGCFGSLTRPLMFLPISKYSYLFVHFQIPWLHILFRRGCAQPHIFFSLSIGGFFCQEKNSGEPVCNGPSCTLFGANAVFTTEKMDMEIFVTGPATCPGGIFGLTDLKMIVLIWKGEETEQPYGICHETENPEDHRKGYCCEPDFPCGLGEGKYCSITKTFFLISLF